MSGGASFRQMTASVSELVRELLRLTALWSERWLLLLGGLSGDVAARLRTHRYDLLIVRICSR
jgi:hypothetical protein